MKRSPVACLLAALACSTAAGTARAAEASGAPEGGQAEAEDDLGHMGQFFGRAGIVGGYRMIIRYDQSPFCREPDPDNQDDQEEESFCGHVAPFALDLAAGFALLDFFEPFVWARLGLKEEPETDTEPLRLVGIGTRIYTRSDSQFKIYMEPGIALELEEGQGDPRWATNNPEYKQDLIFHGAGGFQFDPVRYVGVYLDAGLTVGVLRAMSSSLEVHAGVQLRGP